MATTYYYQPEHSNPNRISYAVCTFMIYAYEINKDRPYFMEEHLLRMLRHHKVSLYRDFTAEARTLDAAFCGEHGVFSFTDLGDLLQCVAAHETEEDYKILAKHLLQEEI